jgi:putative oxidoreductase
MEKVSNFAQLFLRLALGIGFLVPGFDRLGVWGKYGERNISWGDWQHFIKYAGQVMSFLPSTLVNVFAIMATFAEIIFGTLLLVGRWTKIAALGSGILTLFFALSMAISLGIVAPLNYSVFTASAASFLLATLPAYKWSLDNVFLSK